MSTTSAFPARYSVLSASALRDWLAATYDLPAPVNCRLISLSLNDVYQVVAGDQRAYLRVYRHGWRTRDEIDAELALTRDLAESGVAVSTPFKDTNGDDVTQLTAAEGDRFVVLWTEAPGDDVRDITSDHARQYGRLTATIHAATDERSVTYQRGCLDSAQLIDEPMAAIRASLPASDELTELERIAGHVRERLDALSRVSPEFGLCHGDLHPGNVRFANDGTLTLFDFDCCGYGWRGYDLAVFLWNIYGERRPRRWRESRWRAFLRGYAQVRPLPVDLDAQIVDFLIARQIWLTGLDFAGKSGYPPQWVGPGLLRTTLASIRGWQQEFMARSDTT
ncbi:MAG TPA: phosphotransferase [Thermomicrobiales bacterium]|nr:phosphotransferase [Thermomicrobiales bacterium]